MPPLRTIKEVELCSQNLNAKSRRDFNSKEGESPTALAPKTRIAPIFGLPSRAFNSKRQAFLDDALILRCAIDTNREKKNSEEIVGLKYCI
jgi:hypothetical protein